MARGPSGRVVIELDPELKRELHGSLVADGSNLKEWFIAQARAYLRHRRAPDLPGLADINQDFYGQAAEEQSAYNAGPDKGEASQAYSPESGDNSDSKTD